jgi:hypothetical protein
MPSRLGGFKVARCTAHQESAPQQSKARPAFKNGSLGEGPTRVRRRTTANTVNQEVRSLASKAASGRGNRPGRDHRSVKPAVAPGSCFRFRCYPAKREQRYVHSYNGKDKCYCLHGTFTSRNIWPNCHLSRHSVVRFEPGGGRTASHPRVTFITRLSGSLKLRSGLLCDAAGNYSLSGRATARTRGLLHLITRFSNCVRQLIPYLPRAMSTISPINSV